MSFIAEMKRRKIFQIAAVYAVVAWLLVQIVATVEAPLNLPDWVDTLVIVLMAIGFPITLIISWAFNITPDGLVRDLGGDARSQTESRRVEYALIGLLGLAVAYLFVDDYLLDDAAQSPVAQQDADPAAITNEADATTSLMVASSGVLENSVAVLPFANVSPNPDDAYFAVGLHEEVLNQLVKLRNLSVISRTSVLRYTDSDLSIPEIAGELNVGTIMEGSVRYAGNRIRITTQLIDAATDQHLWSETYDREFDDIFAIESDIAMNVANALEAEFSLAEQAAIEQVPTTSPAAYALYLQARNVFTEVGGFATAHALLDRALEIDPEFASALGSKALLYAVSFVNSVQSTGVAVGGREALERQVREYAQRAFALEPGNAAARAALRSINATTWRWSAYEEAVELSDRDRMAASELWIYAWMGRRAEAIRIAERVVELNPNDFGPYLFLGVAQAYAGDIDASMRSLQKGHELAPAHPLIQAWKAYNEIARGNFDDAAAELRLVEQLLGDTRPLVFLPELAYSYGRIGRRDDVERLVAEIEALDDPAAFGAGAWAVTYLALGDEERALEQLELVADKARNHEPDAGYLNVMNLKMNYLADATLEKPEFVDVLARIAGD